jgi:DNA repair ATPase RecN
MTLNRSYLLPLLTLSLTLGSQVFKAPVHAAPLTAPVNSSLIAFTNTSSLANLMTEYRKANVELSQLNRDVATATNMFNQLTAQLDRLIATQAPTPEAKAKIAQRVDQLLQESKQQKEKVMIATGNRERVLQRLTTINAERANMKAGLNNDLKGLTAEVNIVRGNLRALD